MKDLIEYLEKKKGEKIRSKDWDLIFAEIVGYIKTYDGRKKSRIGCYKCRSKFMNGDALFTHIKKFHKLTAFPPKKELWLDKTDKKIFEKRKEQ